MVHVASFRLRVVAPIVRSLGFNRASAATASAGARSGRPRSDGDRRGQPAGTGTVAAVELVAPGLVELVREGDRVALGGPKQRLALGPLTAWRGRIVPVDDLIDGLWPEGPPVWPCKTVQVYVTRLRRAFGSSAEAIRSEAGGYRLDPAVVLVDADAFERDLRAAASQHEHRVDRAIGCLRAR